MNHNFELYLSLSLWRKENTLYNSTQIQDYLRQGSLELSQSLLEKNKSVLISKKSQCFYMDSILTTPISNYSWLNFVFFRQILYWFIASRSMTDPIINYFLKSFKIILSIVASFTWYHMNIIHFFYIGATL